MLCHLVLEYCADQIRKKRAGNDDLQDQIVELFQFATAGGDRPMSFEGTAYGAFLRGMREAGYVENRDSA